MEHFYFNYSWEKRDSVLPVLRRARYLKLPGSSKSEYYRVCLPVWVIDVSFVKDGGFWRMAGEKKWRRHEVDEVHIYPPGTVFESRLDAGMIRHSAFVQFVNGEAGGLDAFFSGRRPPYMVKDVSHRLVEPMIRIAAIGHNRQERGFWEAQAVLFELMARLHSESEPRLGSLDASFSENVDNFLKRNLTRRLDCRELSKALGISSSLLFHRYKRETGSSPMRRHMELRLEYAKAMLINNISLTQIAEATGFSSPFHLSRAFKARCGQSPAEFRKTMKNMNYAVN